MFVIGITGGIATGKSTVAAMFAEMGAKLLDADQVAREIVAPGEPALEQIAATFGLEVLRPDGALDRARLGQIVFSDPKARGRLEAITHPHILKRLADRIARLREQPGEECAIVVVELPLLFEAHARDLVDRVVVVASEQKTQVARLMERAQMTREQALSRIAAQWPLEDKVRLADWVIHTDSTLQDTWDQARETWTQLLNACSAG